MSLSYLRSQVPGLDADLVFGTLGPDFIVQFDWQTQQGPARIPLFDGESLAAWVPPGVAHVGGDLFVWDQGEWGEPSRVRKMDDKLIFEDGGMTLQLTIAGPSIKMVRRDGFWPEKLPRIGTKLPDYPVRLPYWPLVCGASEQLPRDGQGRVGWRVKFAGGMLLEHRWAQTDLEDITISDHFLGVWPPKIISGWRLYSVLLQGFLPDYQPNIWLGQVGQWPGRPLRQREMRVDPDQGWFGMLVEDDGADGIGPRFVVLSTGDEHERSGVFELLRDHYAPEEHKNVTVALDFGTSNSVVACMQLVQGRQRGKAIQLDRHIRLEDGAEPTELLKPLVVAANATWSLEQPWLPGILAPVFEEERRGIDQIPSGIFLRAARSSEREPRIEADSLPFVDYALVGPGLAIEKSPADTRRCWLSGLKWSDTPVPTEKFLEALLTWTVAVCRCASLGVRATYPFAFPEFRRKEYGRLLDQVARRVMMMTGVSVKLENPYRSVPIPHGGANPPLPFVDESSPLILNQYQQFHLADQGDETLDPKFLFVADLGGGTLDVLLGYFFDESTHRTLASESVRIGARDVLELLIKRLGWPPDYNTPELCRTLLEGMARGGSLFDRIRDSADHGREFSQGFAKLSIGWKGNASVSANEFRKDVLIYYLFLCEYVARFIAGVLTQPRLVERVGRAPGENPLPLAQLPAIFSKVPSEGFALSIVLTGNGWGFLELLDGGEERWRAAVFDRVEELTAPRVLRRVDPYLPGAVRKLFTAERTAELTFNDQTVRGSVEVAPNGFVDRSNGIDHPWGTLVGRDTENLLNGTQVIMPAEPALPPPTFSWLRPHERSSYSSAWLNRSSTLISEELKNIRDRQNTEAAGRGYRVLSTQRAFWETVVRRALGLPPL